MRAYWFSNGDKLRYSDQRIPAVGVTHRHDGPLALCRSGLHASVDVMDALQYAPGATLWVVECGDEIIVGDDKLVCRERTYISRHDVDLAAFARWCALQVAHLWNCPPLVRQWLETGDESLRSAARSAAWNARSAAWGATGDAARSARSAAWGATGDAARSAARAAATRAAAEAAAWNAARDAQRAKLLERAGIDAPVEVSP